MKRTLALGLLLAATTAAAAGEMPEGWRTAVCSNAAAQAAHDYANNVIRCVWAGDNVGMTSVADCLPANIPFQFAVAGSEQSVSNVQRALDAAAAALRADLRDRLRESRLLSPTVNWMLRRTLFSATDSRTYLKARNHAAAVSEANVNVSNLLALARAMTPSAVPPVVALYSADETRRNLTCPPAVPGVDYPGIHPERTYRTPFGIGMVLRAPQCRRTFRFRAVAWPNPRLKVTFAWVPVTSSVWIHGWPGKQPKDGYAAFTVDMRSIPRGRRLDVAVFAKAEGGFWGPPSVISFYVSPYEARSYAKDGTLQKIQYLPALKVPPPYDLSPICLPADWTDYYQCDEKKRLFGFDRARPGLIRKTEFSNLGEIVIEHHPNDTPKVSAKVRYFERDGKLDWEETGEEVTRKLAPFRPRPRDE